jgi:hypothetical protein
MNINKARWYALGVVGVLALATAAEAATITNATGPVKLNGKVVTIDPAKPLAFNKGDVLETQGANVTVTSVAGDTVGLEPNARMRNDGDREGIEGLFIQSGAGTALLSPKTTVGVQASWVVVPANQKSKSRVFIEAPADQPYAEGNFRAISGDAQLWYGMYRTDLPVRHSVSLQVDAENTSAICARTAQQNSSNVTVTAAVAGGDIKVTVPKATTVCLEPEGASSTKITNDITSLKAGKVGIETDFVGKQSQNAALGPGTYALIDNSSGAITVVFTKVEFQILKQAIGLTSEFQTLVNSNFSDVN